MLTHTQDTRRARAAAAVANEARSRCLVEIALGRRTVKDVVFAAMTPDGSALRRIRLDQLILAQPGFGPVRAHAFLSVVAATIGGSTNIAGRDIGWLIDHRVGGKRLLAWLDAGSSKTPYWGGFPKSARPATQHDLRGN